MGRRTEWRLNFRISSIFSAVAVILIAVGRACSGSDDSGNALTPGDRQVVNYFKTETDKLSCDCLSDIHTLGDWETRRPELRREAAEMLGLDPMLPRTALRPVITGKIEEIGRAHV